MKYGKQTVSINAVMHRNWLRSEMRLEINKAKVRQYAEEMDNGANFPTPTAFCDPKTEILYVGDGFHRINARKLIGDKSIEIDIKRGTLTDAVLFNIERNVNHRGLPFSSGDLGKCIETLLITKETLDWSQSKIAAFLNCSASYVCYTTKKLGIERPKMVVDKSGNVRAAHCQEDPDIHGRRDKVLGKFLIGTTQSEIAESMGLSRATVQRDIQEALKERSLIRCPHCKGTGFISNLPDE